MNVQFKQLVINNFMSLVHEVINLEDQGVVLVKGVNNYDPLFKSNGSGKSALFDSILWCLTGSTSRGSSSVSNRMISSSGASVELTFFIDSDKYVVTRSCDSNNSGKSLKIIKNDEDISGSTFMKSKKVLESQLSFMNYDILTSIIVLSQGLPSRLSSLRPSDRKSRLEYLSNTDGILGEIQNKINDAYSRLTEESSKLNIEKTKIDTSISTNQSVIDSCTSKINDIKKYNENNSDITSEVIKSYQSKIDEYKTIIDGMRKKYQEILKQESELSSKKQINANSLDSLSKKIKELVNQYKSVSDNICPFCKSVLTSTDDLKSHIEVELSDYKIQYNKYLNEKDELDKIKIENSYEYNEKISKYDAEIIRLTQIINQYNIMHSSIDNYESTINECKKAIEELSSGLLEINNKFNSINKSLSIHGYYKSVISRQFRNFLLDGVINYLNERLKYYSSYLFSNDQVVQFENDGSNINIKLGNGYFEDLSGGEGRRVDIIIQLALRDLSKSESGFSCNLLILDEILDYLDADGINNVLRMLEKESLSIDSLLIVTHRDEIDVPNDSEIIVVKDKNQLSRISK